jgi:hypothetical protein
MVQPAARTGMIQSAARKEWYSLNRYNRLVQPAARTEWYSLLSEENCYVMLSIQIESGRLKVLIG